MTSGEMFLLRRRPGQVGGGRRAVVGARALVPALRVRAARQGAGVRGHVPQPRLGAADGEWHELIL